MARTASAPTPYDADVWRPEHDAPIPFTLAPERVFITALFDVDTYLEQQVIADGGFDPLEVDYDALRQLTFTEAAEGWQQHDDVTRQTIALSLLAVSA